MRPTKVHCFFEQSGVFKHAFIDAGIPAEDYDISDAFGQTDNKCDLFCEIKSAFYGLPSIFDEISQGELIFAFFPCTYFCENNVLFFMGESRCFRTRDVIQVLEHIRQRNRMRARYYEYLLMLFEVCERNKLQLVLENPFSYNHYLVNNFPYKPKVIDRNRRVRGDYYTKPTMYYFLNREPTWGCSFQMDKPIRYIREAKPSNYSGKGEDERSLISPDYARNFINDYILGVDSVYSQPTLFTF